MSTLQGTAPVPVLPLPVKELFTTADLVGGPDGDRGRIRRAVARGQIVKVCHGVYARSHLQDPVAAHLQLVHGCLLRSRHPGVIGGISAALVHALEVGWWTLPTRATFVRPGVGGSKSEDMEVLSTRLPDHHIRHVDGAPVCSVPRTIVDLARSSTPWYDDLTPIVAADSAMRRSPDPVALREACESVIRDLRSCSGLGAARAVLRMTTHLSAGPGETVSRVLLERMGMPTPLLDMAFENDTDTDGDREGVRVPFSWPSLGLLGVVLNVTGHDGGTPTGWSGSREAWEGGPRRWLRDQGWQVVEWSLDELREPWVVSRRLASVMRETGSAVGLREVRTPAVLASAWASPTEPSWYQPPVPWELPIEEAEGGWAAGDWAEA